MTEAKIQEIMALVDRFGNSRRRKGNDEDSPESAVRRYSAQYGKDADDTRASIESALREQVPEGWNPLWLATHPDFLSAAPQPAQAEQPKAVQEPACYQFRSADGSWHSFHSQKHYEDTVADGRWQIRALYTAPQQQEPMTDEQMWQIWNAQGCDEMNQKEATAFARAVERFHRITKD